MTYAHYFVTDIESDGPTPMENSMLSFAPVVVREDGVLVDEFEAVLAPRENRKPDPNTLEFWKSIPDAWAAATTDAEPPELVMLRYVEWVQGFPGKRSFAARPLAFDGIWIDHYLRDFAKKHLLDIHYWGKPVFTTGALDIGTYICGIFNRTDPHTGDIVFPEDWLGHHQHTHRAIDDARGYASLLSRLFKIARNSPPHPDDFIEHT